MSRIFKSMLAAGLIAGLVTSAQAEVAAARVTGHHTVMIGEARVTVLYNGFVTDSGHYQQVAYAYKRLTSDRATGSVPSATDIAAFVVDTGDKVTLVCVEGTEPTPAGRGYLRAVWCRRATVLMTLMKFAPSAPHQACSSV